jgi:two-component system OmpR family response regulator
MTDVLIVEDEPGIREFLRQALSQSAIPFRIVAGGMQALESARLAWPTGVLLDLTLPGRLDGWQVWDRLAAMSAGRPLRVVVFAADLDSQDRAWAEQRGAFGIVRKPASKALLVETLNRALNQTE